MMDFIMKYKKIICSILVLSLITIFGIDLIPKSVNKTYIGYVADYNGNKRFTTYNSKLNIKIEGKKINSLIFDDTFVGTIELGSIKYDAILEKGHSVETKKIFYNGSLEKYTNTIPLRIKISDDFNDLWIIGPYTNNGLDAILASSSNHFEDCKDNIYKIDGY